MCCSFCGDAGHNVVTCRHLKRVTSWLSNSRSNLPVDSLLGIHNIDELAAIFKATYLTSMSVIAVKRKYSREALYNKLVNHYIAKRSGVEPTTRLWNPKLICITTKTSEKFTCYLCQDEKENCEKVKICRCEGYQCYTCFEDYYRRNKLTVRSCPMCRTQIANCSTVTVENPDILPILQGLVR